MIRYLIDSPSVSARPPKRPISRYTQRTGSRHPAARPARSAPRRHRRRRRSPDHHLRQAAAEMVGHRGHDRIAELIDLRHRVQGWRNRRPGLIMRRLMPASVRSANSIATSMATTCAGRTGVHGCRSERQAAWVQTEPPASSTSMRLIVVHLDVRPRRGLRSPPRSADTRRGRAARVLQLLTVSCRRSRPTRMGTTKSFEAFLMVSSRTDHQAGGAPSSSRPPTSSSPPKWSIASDKPFQHRWSGLPSRHNARNGNVFAIPRKSRHDRRPGPCTATG